MASLAPEVLKFPRRKQGLRNEVSRWLKPLPGRGRLRRRAQRACASSSNARCCASPARDLARLGTLPEIIQEISDVADVCLEAVWQVCRRQLVGRYGQPYHQDADGQLAADRAAACLGLGKLGGQELNYSSDVDVIFVYSEEGQRFQGAPAQGRRRRRPALTNHQFFNRLAEAFIAEVTRADARGRAVPDRSAAAAGRATPARWSARWPATRTTTRSGARPGSA